ncbi:MAG TPA: single-stranded DNA-binding protein [Anaerolineaceae bacterium]|nr:single-stranded DNA-binding protein [Anaerolineaceae bacterium]
MATDHFNITFTGNLGADPEMKFTPSGQAVANFSAASNRQYTGQDGQTVKETIWVRVTAWGRLAEICNQYLKKGRKVLVVGRLTPDPQTGGPRLWTGRNGSVNASYEVNAREVYFLDNGNGHGEAHAAPEAAPASQPAGELEDIPF